MNRIDVCLARIRAKNGTALAPYLVAGDPLENATTEAMHALVAAGADMIEIGVPFSDPMADGPVIQAAYERSVAKGIGAEKTLAYVSDFRKSNSTTPVILMGYTNFIERFGHSRFAKAAAESGVDGVIIVDSPPEVSAQLQSVLRPVDIHQIFLVAPTSPEHRIKKIAALARGFIYYVSMKGVTGSKRVSAEDVAPHLEQIRQHTDLPLAVGFGIKDAQSAAALAPGCDAVAIGTALVSRLAEARSLDQMKTAIENFLAPIKQAL